jgi:hypothetical protein
MEEGEIGMEGGGRMQRDFSKISLGVGGGEGHKIESKKEMKIQPGSPPGDGISPPLSCGGPLL